jgi:hypothetical protein
MVLSCDLVPERLNPVKQMLVQVREAGSRRIFFVREQVHNQVATRVLREITAVLPAAQG